MKQGHLQDKTAFSTEKALSISPHLNANVPSQFFQCFIKEWYPNYYKRYTSDTIISFLLFK